jgi:hypothetical protein
MTGRATKTPRPTRVSTRPRFSSDLSAWRAVMRLAPSSSAIWRSEGTRSPRFSAPEPIFSSNQRAMRW